MKKKLLSLLLATAMTASLAGCGGGGKSAADAMDEAQESAASGQEGQADQTQQESQAKTEPAGEGNGEAKELDTSERVDLVVYQLGDAPADEAKVDEKINEILLEKLNVTVDFQFTTWVDWQQK